ncbi:MarR family transcriptional regulator [Nocardioides sp. CN2-186]|uniref:MarR family winged helix-turn-helix transcriptional regulator n=1 Tax=Nocardioides tweenelious TaxID=3156607 RepID=UPI0032B5E90D
MPGRARDTSTTLQAEQAETWFAYMRVVLRMDYEVNRELQADTGLSHQDFHVLNALADSPGQRLRLSDLAIRIGWERSRVSHHVLRMEGRGLVDRSPSATDRRATDAVLTDEGRAALGRAIPGHVALVKTLFFDGLDPELLGPLRQALEQIYAQVVTHGSLPAPPSHQVDWTEA